MNRHRLAPGLILVLSLGACAVGPDYRQPAMPHSPAFARAEARTDDAPQLPVNDAEFWHAFGDPQLSELIALSLAANHDLRIALARVDKDAAILRDVGLDRFPTVTASAQAGRERVSVYQSYGFPRTSRPFDASVNASWEIDLFGRVRRSIEAQRAEVAASSADFQAMQIVIVGEVANVYVDLRGAQEQLSVALANVENQRETLRIVGNRLDAGRGSNFDVVRARAQLESTQARVPALRVRIAVDQHRLAVLTGQSPAALIADLDAPRPLPRIPEAIDPETPGELLRRRPDVAAAEERLHAATARIGVATADLYPRLSLGAMVGTFAFGPGAVFKSGSATNSIVLGVDWSFLDIGRVRARIAASDAEAEGLLAQFQQTVLRALEDTENALVRFSRTRDEDAHLERAAAESAHAARLARARFQAGEISLYEVLDAERTQLRAQEAFADGRARSATAAVALYRALAGGWSQKLPQRDDLAAGSQGSR